MPKPKRTRFHVTYFSPVRKRSGESYSPRKLLGARVRYAGKVYILRPRRRSNHVTFDLIRRLLKTKATYTTRRLVKQRVRREPISKWEPLRFYRDRLLKTYSQRGYKLGDIEQLYNTSPDTDFILLDELFIWPINHVPPAPLKFDLILAWFIVINTKLNTINLWAYRLGDANVQSFSDAQKALLIMKNLIIKNLEKWDYLEFSKIIAWTGYKSYEMSRAAQQAGPPPSQGPC
jgi:hypothetical protein